MCYRWPNCAGWCQQRGQGFGGSLSGFGHEFGYGFGCGFGQNLHFVNYIYGLAQYIMG